MDLLQRFAVSPKHFPCEHQIMKARVFDEIFENFVDNYDYLVENNSDHLSIMTKCYKCYQELSFKYNLTTGEFTASKNKYNMYDKALDKLGIKQEFIVRVFFEINFPIHDADQDKRAMMIQVKKVADSILLPDKSPKFYNICRTFAMSKDEGIVSIIEGIIKNHIEIDLNFDEFKRLYSSLNKEFNKENVTFKLAKK